IEYDEDNNTFQFHQLPVCKNIVTLCRYAYVRINDIILIFGGLNYSNISKSVHKYSIREKKWITFKDVLPVPLYHCSGILNKDNNYVYVIGGYTSRDCKLTNMKIKLSELIYHIQLKNEIKFAIQHWIRILKIGLGWIDDFNKIIIKYVRGFELSMILRGHGNTVNSVRFSEDGRKIVSASYDHTVRIWDVASGKQLQIFRGHTDR
ncbi:WD-40 repeat protein, partial [Reticulomyxa filosa]